MTGSLVARALAVLAAASACTPAHSPHERDTCLHYEPESALTGAEAAALEDAARVWRESGACVVRGPEDVQVRRASTGSDVPARYRHFVKGNVIAFWSKPDRTIWLIADRVDRDHLRPVWIHEIAHAMGMVHTNVITDCAAPVVTEWCAMTDRIDANTVAAIRPQYRFTH